jgi:hypothetical protein
MYFMTFDLREIVHNDCEYLYTSSTVLKLDNQCDAVLARNCAKHCDYLYSDTVLYQWRVARVASMIPFLTWTPPIQTAPKMDLPSRIQTSRYIRVLYIILCTSAQLGTLHYGISVRFLLSLIRF